MLPLYADLYVMRFLNAVIEEGLSGRLQDPGSFNWVNPDGWELRVVDWEPLVPTHGNFAGPGYSCGQRGEFSVEEIEAYPVAQVFDPVLGYRRDDYVDILANQHDIAYKAAEGKSNYWELIKAADIALLNGMQALLDGTSPLLSDGGIPTQGELRYGQSLADAFTLKLIFADEAGVLIEKLRSSGYGLDQINGFLTSLSQLRVLISDSDGLPDVIAPWTDLFDTSQTVVRRDPLVLDLDGDGLETVGVKDGAYFDHDGNGFAEQTGWVGSDDGLLVMDRDGDGIIENGGELFGDQTILQNGQKATDGFQALAEWDSNADGKIDIDDAVWSQLKIWQDFDGDGYSSPDELFSLDEAGVKAINLNHTDTSTPDGNGNTLIQQGTFVRSDDTTGSLGGYELERDVTYTIANEWLDVSEDIAELPDLQGYGNVYDLHQAMARDATGQLQSLVEQFMAATDIATRNSLMEQILFKWTGSDAVGATSRGYYINAKKLVALENLFGKSFLGMNGANPNDLAAPLLAQAYEGIFEMYYSQLMAQTHLKDVYGAITYCWDEETQSLKGDLTDAIAVLQDHITSGTATVDDAQEFMRTIHGMNAEDVFDLAPLSSAFELNDEDANWQIDSAGKTVIGGTVLNDVLSAEAGVDTAIRGDQGNDVLYGNTGKDVLYGNEGNDNIVGGCDDDILVGGKGDDNLYGQNANDTLIGGSGNDYLYGGQGDDTYVFGKGFGSDSIIEEAGVDTLQFASGLTTDSRAGQDLSDNLQGFLSGLAAFIFIPPLSPPAAWSGTLRRASCRQYPDGAAVSCSVQSKPLAPA